MKVHWSARAVARLDAIHAHIARENPTAALIVVQQMLRRSGQIATFKGRL